MRIAHHGVGLCAALVPALGLFWLNNTAIGGALVEQVLDPARYIVILGLVFGPVLYRLHLWGDADRAREADLGRRGVKDLALPLEEIVRRYVICAVIFVASAIFVLRLFGFSLADINPFAS